MSSIKNALSESTFVANVLTAPNRARQEKIEKEKELIDSISKPDYEHEAKKSSWTHEEAAAFTLDWNPREIKRRGIKPSEFIGPDGENYQKRYELIDNTALDAKFADFYFCNDSRKTILRIFPRLFIEWAEQVELDLPNELGKLVKKYHPKPESTDWEAECKVLKKCAEDLTEKNQNLEEQLILREKRIEELSDENNPINKKEKKSLLKLFMGVLSIAYTSEVVKKGEIKAAELADELSGNGISLDEDTIRKYLSEGKKEFFKKSTE